MTMMLAGVIGDPIGHSRSPRLHGHWLRRLGIEGQYVPLHVRPDDLEQALRLLPRLGFRGINVTIPHKETVLALADHATPRARRIGAANTVTFRDGLIHADNTDGYGFMAALRADAQSWQAAAGPVAVLGAGGAARAVVAALLDAGVPELRLANRTRARAESLAADMGGPVRIVDWSDAGDMIDGTSLVVNTTALGMAGQPPFDLPLDGVRPGMVAMDIVYVPLETPFLAAARARGAICVDGLGMLLHQAVPGFETWFGQTPVVDQDLRDAVLAP